MLEKQITLAMCAALLGAACAHDAKPRERTSVSAVTNQELSGDQAEPGKTRMQYTEVSNRESLGRDKAAESDLASGPSRTEELGTTDTRGRQAEGQATATPSRTAADPESCELAVYFPSNSSKLDAKSEERLDKVAACMKRREVDHATIVGQTDPSGSERHNDELGLERARTVAEYLRERGVPEEQIRVRSKGEVASAEARELWPVERRAGIDVKR